jgi:hypothetical protein
MSTNRFPDVVRTNVEVGSLGSSGSQRMDLRIEMSPMVPDALATRDNYECMK